MLQVSVHRHFPGLSNFIATVQVLVSWLMCSHVGNGVLAVLFQKLLHSSSSGYSNSVALLCPIHRQTCTVSSLFAEQFCISGSRYAGLEKIGKAKRLVSSSSE